MRHEKELLKWPVPECPELEQKEPDNESYKKIFYHRFAAQIAEIAGEQVLGFTVFNMGGGATCRFWQSEKQHGMQVFDTRPYGYNQRREPGRMYEACIDSEYMVLNYWGNEDSFYSTKSAEKTVLDFLGKKMKDPGKALGEYQKKRREDSIRERNEKERDYIRNRFAPISSPPKEFEQWCIDTAMRADRYFFYEYTGKKLQRGKCSHCGTWSELPGIREFREGICPVCGSKVEFRSLRRLQKGSIRSYYGVGFLDKLDDEYCMRSFNSTIIQAPDESGEPVREVYFYEIERVFMSVDLKVKDVYTTGLGTWSVTVDGFHSECYSMPQETLIYPGNIKELRTHKGIRTEIEILAERGELYGSVNKIFDVASRRTEMEYLIKTRFYRLASDILRRYPGEGTGLNKGKNAAQVLGIPASELDKLRKADPELQQLKTIREMYLYHDSIKQDVMEDICWLRIGPEYALTLEKMAEGSSLRRALNYIKKQGHRNEGNKVLIEWRDYMHICEAVGFDTDDPQIFMPKNITAAHEQIQRVYENNKNKYISEGIERQADRLAGLSWVYKGLSIRPAKSQQELITEGQALHHCVGKGGYDRKMAQGKTAIFFIRHKKQPDIPYVTLEMDLMSGKVIQCYAARDRYPGDLVKAFYLKWERDIVPAGLKIAKEAKSA